MIKKTIKYLDYNGDEREEDFYFNINKAEMMRLNMSEQGGYSAYLKRIIAEKDNVKLYKIFEELVKLSYGEKSPDGKRFIKSNELVESFMQTEAYSNLIMEFFSNADYAANFFKGVLPKDIVDQIKE